MFHDEKGIQKFLLSLNLQPITCENVKVHLDQKNVKNRNIIICNFGFFIVQKQKIGIALKIKDPIFVSYFDFNSIQCISKTMLKVIIIKSQPLILEFSNISIFLNRINQFYAIFFYPTQEKKENNVFTKLRILNPPVAIKQPTQQAEAFNDKMSLQYYSLCIKYNQQIDPQTIQAFRQFEGSSKACFTITKKCAVPENYKTISLVLIYEPNVRILKFDGFAHCIVCKIISHILKYNHNITTIVIQNYDDIIYSQFGFKVIKKPSALSWTFVNVNLLFQQTIELFTQFTDYHGDIQMFSIYKMKFNPEVAKHLSAILSTSFCFRTLEILEINGLEVFVEDSLNIYNNIILTVPYLKSIQILKMTGWNHQIFYSFPFRDSLFLHTNSLKHFAVNSLDFRYLSKQIIFPQSLKIIEFNSCLFNSTSIRFVLQSLSKLSYPLILSLKSMQIKKNELEYYITSSKEITIFKNIVELDFSNNSITKKSVNAFYKIFIQSSPIKMINLSGVFDSKVGILCKLLSILKRKNLWGIELVGRKNKIFGDSFDNVLKSLQELKSLQYINLSFQPWYPKFNQEIVNLLNTLKSLKYLCLDQSGFSDLNSFVSFYNFIFSHPNIIAVNKPFSDLFSLIPDKKIINTIVPLQKILGMLKMKSNIPSKVIRNHYFLRYNDMNNFDDFNSSFPIYMIGIPDQDRLDLTFVSKKSTSIKTLLDYDFNEIREEKDFSFSEAQNKFIEYPFEDIIAYKIQQFIIPPALFLYRNKIQEVRTKYINACDVPKIKQNVNKAYILSKYRKWIVQKNQKLFRNISMISNLFQKVYDIENGADSLFGDSIPIYEPPFSLSHEIIQIISSQVENIITNDEDGENDTDNDEKSFYTTSHHSSEQNADETELSTMVSSPLFNNDLTDIQSKLSENTTDNPVENKKAPDLREKLFDFDDIFEDNLDDNDELLKGMINDIKNTTQHNALERIQNSCHNLLIKIPKRFIRIENIPQEIIPENLSLPNIFSSLAALSSKICTILTGSENTSKKLRNIQSMMTLPKSSANPEKAGNLLFNNYFNSKISSSFMNEIDDDDDEGDFLQPVMLKKPSSSNNFSLSSSQSTKKYSSSSNLLRNTTKINDSNLSAVPTNANQNPNNNSRTIPFAEPSLSSQDLFRLNIDSSSSSEQINSSRKINSGYNLGYQHNSMNNSSSFNDLHKKYGSNSPFPELNIPPPLYTPDNNKDHNINSLPLLIPPPIINPTSILSSSLDTITPPIYNSNTTSTSEKESDSESLLSNLITIPPPKYNPTQQPLHNILNTSEKKSNSESLISNLIPIPPPKNVLSQQPLNTITRTYEKKSTSESQISNLIPPPKTIPTQQFLDNNIVNSSNKEGDSKSKRITLESTSSKNVSPLQTLTLKNNTDDFILEETLPDISIADVSQIPHMPSTITRNFSLLRRCTIPDLDQI